jgi:hypothetical protein
VRRPWFMTYLRRGDDFVSASQVARLGTCEYQLMLEQRHGRRTTAEQDHAIAQGIARHERFHEQGEQAATGALDSKRWCFIATAIYGMDAPETAILRAFRDKVLRRWRVGRAAVALYYRYSPPLAAALSTRPILTAMVRSALSAVVAILQRAEIGWRR